MFTGKIEFTGRTATDVEDAINAAQAAIVNGNTSGFDSNSDGSYSFDLAGEEDEMPDGALGEEHEARMDAERDRA